MLHERPFMSLPLLIIHKRGMWFNKWALTIMLFCSNDVRSRPQLCSCTSSCNSNTSNSAVFSIVNILLIQRFSRKDTPRGSSIFLCVFVIEVAVFVSLWLVIACFCLICVNKNRPLPFFSIFSIFVSTLCDTFAADLRQSVSKRNKDRPKWKNQ